MSEQDTPTGITSDQALERLERARNGGVDDGYARRVHAFATAAFGIVIGAFFALHTGLDETSWEPTIIVGYVAILLGLAAWQSRAARVMPRHGRRMSWIGLGCTAILMISAVLAANVRQAGREADGITAGEPLWLLVVIALVIAAPMVVAGILIHRGER